LIGDKRPPIKKASSFILRLFHRRRSRIQFLQLLSGGTAGAEVPPPHGVVFIKHSVEIVFADPLAFRGPALQGFVISRSGRVSSALLNPSLTLKALARLLIRSSTPGYVLACKSRGPADRLHESGRASVALGPWPYRGGRRTCRASQVAVLTSCVLRPVNLPCAFMQTGSSGIKGPAPRRFPGSIPPGL